MRKLITSLVILLLSVVSIAAAQNPSVVAGVASVEFLDVGQGDAILITSPEGKTALMDAGPSNTIVSLLKRRGVTTLDLVAVSHHHSDHYGGMDAVIRAYHPRVFLATNSSHTTPAYLKLLKLVQDDGMTAIFPSDVTRKISLGSIALFVFPQPPEDRADENDNSIGIRVQYGSFSVVLTGDSEAKERTYWEQSVPQLVQNATVAKLAHHGSRNGTDARWLSLVRPRLAVASLGSDNEFGHPHPETLTLLHRMNIPLLRTDRDGTIRVVSDGKNWGEVIVGKSPRGPPRRDVEIGVVRHEAKAARKLKAVTRIVDINTASQDKLETLPGIGPTIAQRIIAGRPYQTVDELRRVKGIGEKRLDEIRPYATAR